MRYLVITDNPTAAQLEAAIAILKAKRSQARIQSTRDELDADLHELYDLLLDKVTA